MAVDELALGALHLAPQSDGVVAVAAVAAGDHRARLRGSRLLLREAGQVLVEGTPAEIEASTVLLKAGGTFCAKVFDGPELNELVARIKVASCRVNIDSSDAFRRRSTPERLRPLPGACSLLAFRVSLTVISLTVLRMPPPRSLRRCHENSSGRYPPKMKCV